MRLRSIAGWTAGSLFSFIWPMAMVSQGLAAYPGPSVTSPSRNVLETRIAEMLSSYPPLQPFVLTAYVGDDLSIRLNGVVPDEREKDLASRAVAAVQGAGKITNDIAVIPPRESDLSASAAATTPAGTTKPPAQAAANPSAEASAPPLPVPHEVTPQTRLDVILGSYGPLVAVTGIINSDGQVLLRGKVGQAGAKAMAEQLTLLALPNAKVENHIQVETAPTLGQIAKGDGRY